MGLLVNILSELSDKNNIKAETLLKCVLVSEDIQFEVKEVDGERNLSKSQIKKCEFICNQTFSKAVVFDIQEDKKTKELLGVDIYVGIPFLSKNFERVVSSILTHSTRDQDAYSKTKPPVVFFNTIEEGIHSGILKEEEQYDFSDNAALIPYFKRVMTAVKNNDMLSEMLNSNISELIKDEIRKVQYFASEVGYLNTEKNLVQKNLTRLKMWREEEGDYLTVIPVTSAPFLVKVGRAMTSIIDKKNIKKDVEKEHRAKTMRRNMVQYLNFVGKKQNLSSAFQSTSYAFKSSPQSFEISILFLLEKNHNDYLQKLARKTKMQQEDVKYVKTFFKRYANNQTSNKELDVFKSKLKNFGLRFLRTFFYIVNNSELKSSTVEKILNDNELVDNIIAAIALKIDIIHGSPIGDYLQSLVKKELLENLRSEIKSKQADLNDLLIKTHKKEVAQ